MRIVIVIVTYNRLEKLIKTLNCYDNQTSLFNSIVVVDNCSTDGTVEYLTKWSKISSKYEKYIILKKENSGGAGGFYEGQKYALSLNPDWIYVSDDDAYPELKLIEKFNRILQDIDDRKISAICTAVYNNAGMIDYEHRRTYNINKGYRFVDVNSQSDDYQKIYFRIDFLSYIGSFINVKALKKVGLCNPKLFIYYDDTEHSLRLLKYGSIFCFPELKVLHDSGYDTSKLEEVLYTWRDYYSLRNYLNMLKIHFPLCAINITIRYIYGALKNKDAKLKLIITALFDGWLNILGKHKTYKPGFVKKNKLNCG